VVSFPYLRLWNAMRKSSKLFERLFSIQQLQPSPSHPWIAEQTISALATISGYSTPFDVNNIYLHITLPYVLYWAGFRHVHITRVASSCLLSMSDQIPLLSFIVLFLVSSLIYPTMSHSYGLTSSVTPSAPSQSSFWIFRHHWNTRF